MSNKTYHQDPMCHTTQLLGYEAWCEITADGDVTASYTDPDPLLDACTIILHERSVTPDGYVLPEDTMIDTDCWQEYADALAGWVHEITGVDLEALLDAWHPEVQEPYLRYQIPGYTDPDPAPRNLVAYVTCTHLSPDPARAFNGGAYSFGATRFLDTWTGEEVAVRQWTSADFPYCPVWGSFGCSCPQADHDALWALDAQVEAWYDARDNDDGSVTWIRIP